MMAESIVLFGGPQDGKVIEVDAAPPLDYRIPIAPAPWPISEPGNEDQMQMRHGLYTPRIDRLGVVQRNLAGHPIYEWKGEQS